MDERINNICYWLDSTSFFKSKRVSRIGDVLVNVTFVKRHVSSVFATGENG